VRGSAAVQSVYETETSVSERLKGVLELNVNASFAPAYMGYYTDQFGPQTTFAVSGDTVTGTSFVTKTVTVTKPLVDATTDSEILRYVDEEDIRYSELFPIESIFLPNRPSPGIAKWVNSNLPYQVPGSHVRFYVPGKDDNIKYWRSWSAVKTKRPTDPAPTVGSSENRIGYNMGPFAVWKPGVNDRGIWINKIKIAVQNYYALPTSYSVEVLFEGSQTWTSVWSNTDSGSAGSKPWPTDGTLKIYYNNGAWTSTPDLERLKNLRNGGIIVDAVKIRGIRLMVTKMRKFSANRSGLDYATAIYSAPLEVIEMSPRLAIDISDSIMSFEMTSNIAESDSPLPVGSISANDMKVTVENYGDLFDYENVNSLLYGYQSKNAVMDIYFSTEVNPIGWETNRIFYGRVDDSEQNDEAKTDFDVLDGMSLLQQLKITNFIARSARVSTIIRRILDITTGDVMDFDYPNGMQNTEDPVIDYFYANDQMAYDVLADLAESYQLAMFYNADNVFRVLSKGVLVNSGTYSTVLTESDYSGVLGNIKSIQSTPGKPVNDVTITWEPHYTPIAVSSSDTAKPLWEAQRQPAVEAAWQAENEILGAAPLYSAISDVTTDYIEVDQEGGEYFAWSGYLVVNSEVIAYEGKEYMARKVGEAAYQPYWVKDQAEYDALASSIYPGSRLYFSGKLKIQQRAAFSSSQAAHAVDTAAQYPYANNSFPSFQTWKTCYYLNGSPTLNNNRGAQTYKFDKGMVYNLRNQSSTGGIYRRGVESAIRMVGPTPNDLKTLYSSDPEKACLAAMMSYIAWAPEISTDVRIVPSRVSAGIRLPGKVGEDGEALTPMGLHSYAGVILGARSQTGSPAQLSGWLAEIQLTVAANGGPNVRLYRLTQGSFSTRATATEPIAPHISTLNGYTTTKDTFYDVDISFWPKLENGQDGIRVTINGKNVITYVLPAGETVDNSYAYGAYVRGNTWADFDYIYWSAKANEDFTSGWSNSSVSNSDEINIRDAITGGTTGPFMWWASDTERMFNPYKSSTAQFGLHEFGPIIHEVKVMRPKWDKPYLNPYVPRPVISAASYKTPVTSLDRWGAELLVMNSRRHAVDIGGVDSAGLGVYGTPILAGNEQYTMDEYLREQTGDPDTSLINAKILASRKIHGLIQMDLDSKWIQNKALMLDMMKFIGKYASIDCDEVEAEIFGNPLLEPGDIVAIYSPEVNYLGLTNRFVVTSVSHSWDNGLSTDITARRVV
jgi:hypothetical protein